LIAAKLADNRKVPQIAFKPDRTKHAKAAPLQAQRRDAGDTADRCPVLPRHRHPHDAGINRTYVSSVERCERNVSIDNIEKIARALKTDVWKLLKPDLLDA
jgi:Helix-turn-helix